LLGSLGTELWMWRYWPQPAEPGDPQNTHM
jgi:hypothetical protein